MKIVIVGAGMIGLCSAYYLNKRGYEVIIVDEGDGSDNCSFGNAGYFSPSHLIPLASPGIVSQGIKWMTNPESPFFIKPSMNLDLIKWGLNFYKAASQSRVAAAAPIMGQLLMESRTLIEEILSETNIETEFGDQGILMYCKSEKELHHEAEAGELAKKHGQEVDLLTSAEAEKLNPGFEIDVAGAIHFKNDAWFTPHLFMNGFANYLQGQGVQFEYHQKVSDFETQGGKITKLITENEEFVADQFLVATGSFSARLLNKIGVKILLQGGKGYSFVVPEPPVMPKMASILTEARIAVTPMAHGLRFAGTMEINGLDLSINPRRIRGIEKSIPEYFPQFNEASFKGITHWAGLRPCSPDGLPYIGRTNKFSNLIVATGHAMLGISLGPITGQLVAEVTAEENMHIDDKLLKVDRYS